MEANFAALLALLVVSVVSVSGCIQQYQPGSGPQQTPQQPETPPTPPSSGGSEFFVQITAEGFAPKSLTIAAGDTVTWVNQGSGPNWPASAMHPTHTLYPGSDINKSGTSEQAQIFDACHGLPTGQSYSFTFNEAGSWNYHDHLNTAHFGTIIVQ